MVDEFESPLVNSTYATITEYARGAFLNLLNFFLFLLFFVLYLGVIRLSLHPVFVPRVLPHKT